MKSIKRKEPKLWTLILTAASGIVLGVLLGVSLLLARPAKVVATLPDEATLSQPGNYNTYYTPGRVDGGESTNLRSSTGRIQRRSPGPVSFSEGEVNYFLESIEFGEAPAEEGSEEEVRVGTVNFRLEGDQAFATLKMTLDPNGSPFEVLAWAELGFLNTEAGPELVVERMRVNSLPVPKFGGALASMIESKVAEFPWPEELLEMWQNITNIEIESGKLITEVGLRRG